MAPEKREGEGDPVAALSALYDDHEPVTDLPRSPWRPTPEALADLDRRIAQGAAGSWKDWIRRTVAMAARVRKAQPDWSWPEVTGTTRLEWFQQLDQIRPHLLETNFARDVTDDEVLYTVVAACLTIDHYHRAMSSKR